MRAAESSHRVVEGARPLEVAEVAGAGDDRELGARDRLLEPARDGERRARV
jgi:hypothetical protein